MPFEFNLLTSTSRKAIHPRGGRVVAGRHPVHAPDRVFPFRPRRPADVVPHHLQREVRHDAARVGAGEQRRQGSPQGPAGRESHHALDGRLLTRGSLTFPPPATVTLSRPPDAFSLDAVSKVMGLSSPHSHSVLVHNPSPSLDAVSKVVGLSPQPTSAPVYTTTSRIYYNTVKAPS